jgi:hypothetical protein
VEVLLLIAAAALGLFGYEKSKAKPAQPVAAGGAGTDPAANTIGATDGGGVTTQPPPPVRPPPPVNPGPLAPGVYPAGTVGALAILVQVIGGDGDSRVTATPGGTVGPFSGDSKTFWYGPGTMVVFSAAVDRIAILTAFDHFEGPGVVSRSNPIRVPIQSAGFIKGVFAFLGHY